MVDLAVSDDLVEDGRERLILPNDLRRNERRHDQLPLTNVRFHGDSAKMERDAINKTEIQRTTLSHIYTSDRQADRQPGRQAERQKDRQCAGSDKLILHLPLPPTSQQPNFGLKKFQKLFGVVL